jgi:hypothetical protein
MGAPTQGRIRLLKEYQIPDPGEPFRECRASRMADSDQMGVEYSLVILSLETGTFSYLSHVNFKYLLISEHLRTPPRAVDSSLDGHKLRGEFAKLCPDG